MSFELMWIKHLLEELRLNVKLPLTMHCDNQATIHITLNLVFNEWTNHIEVDCHLAQEMVESEIIATSYVFTGAQIADMCIKPLCKTRLYLIYNKLGLYDTFVPA